MFRKKLKTFSLFHIIYDCLYLSQMLVGAYL